MSPVHHHLYVHRRLASWLIVLALAVRLLVPAGYMPMAGKFGLEICAGQMADGPAMPSMPAMGAMHHSVANAHDKHGKTENGGHVYDCGFSAAVGGAMDLPVIMLPAMLAPIARPVGVIRQMTARPGLGLAAPPPPKTGPPIFLR